MYFSLSLLSAFAAVAYGQGQPVQTVTAQPLAGCSGCYIIANVDQVIFADYTVTQTQTAVASQGVGRNGSVVTTSFVQPLPAFSFGTAGLLSGQPVSAQYIPLTGTVITLNGATLTSPTAYNVFHAYTEFQLTQVGGVCSTQAFDPVSVPGTPIPLPANAGPDAIFEAERQFIAGIPQLSCAAGGAFISTQVPVPAVITTTTSTTTGIFRPTPIAASQTSAAAAATTSGPSAAATTSDSGIEISMGPSASGSEAPTTSVAQGGASGFRAYSTTISLGAFVALFALSGLGAWVL